MADKDHQALWLLEEEASRLDLLVAGSTAKEVRHGWRCGGGTGVLALAPNGWGRPQGLSTTSCSRGKIKMWGTPNPTSVVTSRVAAGQGQSHSPALRCVENEGRKGVEPE
ncbi:hypothetical protein NDU88_004862 [Pleurodeles waltl]|uniref:Uncharacterized protein n=1 Tax=Pleurodeles waltl TaxID=8319 RepID=A0AAV7MV41_PLEWA|nr:hypothetical protein NDU88_004862 [Pleurodeles waltl]